MCPEAMDGTVADSYTPDLGIRVPGKQTLRSGERVLGQLEGATVHVDRHHFAFVPSLYLGAHVLFVDFQAATGVFLLAVMRCSPGHCDPPHPNASSAQLHFIVHHRRQGISE
jgi:hypothetical protein